MKRTPEQEAARRARRARSDRDHSFQKCPCGNVAGLDQIHCRACREGMDRSVSQDEITDALAGKLSSEEMQQLIDRMSDELDDATAELEEVSASRDEAESELEKRDADAFNVLRAVRDWFDNVILMGRR